MIDRFLHFNVELLAARRSGDDVARFAPIGVRPSTGAGLLWVPAGIFDEPRGRFHKPEVSMYGSRDDCANNSERHDDASIRRHQIHRTLHGAPHLTTNPL